MISPIFILCGVLLVTGIHADSKADQIKGAAANFGMNVFNDLLNGKDLKQALADRGVEAAGSVDGDGASAAKSALKRVQELLDGESWDKVLANAAAAGVSKANSNWAKNDAVLNALGGDKKVAAALKEGINILQTLFG